MTELSQSQNDGKQKLATNKFMKNETNNRLITGNNNWEQQLVTFGKFKRQKSKLSLGTTLHLKVNTDWVTGEHGTHKTQNIWNTQAASEDRRLDLENRSHVPPNRSVSGRT